MKTSIPHVNTIPDLTDRLRAKRGAGFPVQLFVFIPIVSLMLWYLFMARAEVLHFYTNFSWEDLVHPFGYIAPIALLLSLALSLKAYIVWGKRVPANFRVQHQSIAPKALLAGAITATLFTSVMASAALTVVMSSAQEQPMYYAFLFLFAIFSTAFLAAKVSQELVVLRHYLGTFWQRVQVTATFDKASYRLGERIKVQVRDRLSEGSAASYRVHLSYVEEKIDYTVGSRETDREYRRHPNYNVLLDVTAAELHRGVALTLPETSPTVKRITALNNKRPRYWEVLVEEHGGRFYARFFVNVI